jgi:hypothetical protein
MVRKLLLAAFSAFIPVSAPPSHGACHNSYFVVFGAVPADPDPTGESR